MVWKKKLRSPQYTFNSEKVFLVATQPSTNTGRSSGATVHLWKKRSGT